MRNSGAATAPRASTCSVRQVVVGDIDQVRYQIGGSVESVVRQTVAKPGERSGQQNDHEVTEIRLGRRPSVALNAVELLRSHHDRS